MSHSSLSILVLVREAADPRPPAQVISRGAGVSDRGLRRLANPSDMVALEEALSLKDTYGASVAVLAVGPARLDDMLRLAVSMGADRVIRVWDHGMERGDATADARVFARAVAMVSPSLVLTGNRMLDRGDDPVPALATAALDHPCINAAVSLAVKQEGVRVTRKSDRGGRQVVTSPLPCTVLFDEGKQPRYPSVAAVTGALEAKIEKWDLAALGLPFWEVGATGAYLSDEEFGVPRPDPVRVATPDAKLPAFERILSLLSGGIKAREGKLHALPAESATDELWRILKEEGLVPADC